MDGRNAADFLHQSSEVRERCQQRLRLKTELATQVCAEANDTEGKDVGLGELAADELRAGLVSLRQHRLNVLGVVLEASTEELLRVLLLLALVVFKRDLYPQRENFVKRELNIVRAQHLDGVVEGEAGQAGGVVPDGVRVGTHQLVIDVQQRQRAEGTLGKIVHHGAVLCVVDALVLKGDLPHRKAQTDGLRAAWGVEVHELDFRHDSLDLERSLLIRLQPFR